jgi:predicted DNA-binding transcriptional regulator AlpA
VTELLQVGTATIAKYIRLRNFPRPVRLTPRTFRWWRDDVFAWLKRNGRRVKVRR